MPLRYTNGARTSFNRRSIAADLAPWRRRKSAAVRAPVWVPSVADDMNIRPTPVPEGCSHLRPKPPGLAVLANTCASSGGLAEMIAPVAHQTLRAKQGVARSRTALPVTAS